LGLGFPLSTELPRGGLLGNRASGGSAFSEIAGNKGLEAAIFTGGDPEDWQRYVLAWAKKNGRGMYHPAMLEAPELTYEHNAYLRSIGRL
jgi:hypothetical protein